VALHGLAGSHVGRGSRGCSRGSSRGSSKGQGQQRGAAAAARLERLHQRLLQRQLLAQHFLDVVEQHAQLLGHDRVACVAALVGRRAAQQAGHGGGQAAGGRAVVLARLLGGLGRRRSSSSRGRGVRHGRGRRDGRRPAAKHRVRRVAGGGCRRRRARQRGHSGGLDVQQAQALLLQVQDVALHGGGDDVVQLPRQEAAPMGRQAAGHGARHHLVHHRLQLVVQVHDGEAVQRLLVGRHRRPALGLALHLG
jgi:hypothetical protein